MSKKHADQIMNALKVLQTVEGRSHAFAYLSGILCAKAEAGKAVSATALAEAVESAVEDASKNNRAERRARGAEAA